MSAPPTRSPLRIPSWAGDLLGALVAVVTTLVPGPGMGLGAPHPGGPRGPLLDGLPLIVLLGAILLIPLRRRFSILTLSAALGLFCAMIALHAPATGVGIVAVLAAYSVGSGTDRRTTLAVGGAATTLVVVLSVTVAEFGVIDPSIFQIAAGIAVAAALGDSSRSHREFVTAATERAERAEQTREAEVHRRVAEERLRIAQDLHDTVAHQISVISLNAGVASSSLGSAPEKARASLGTIRTSARLVLTEIGTLLQYLRADSATPGAGDADPDTNAAPQRGIKDLDELYSSFAAAGLRVGPTTTGELDRIAPTTGTVAYRIVQEGLTNALKHGAGGEADLSITAAGTTLSISITNPVSDRSPNQRDPHRGGLGLTGIRERVAAVGGSVEITSLRDRFTLAATLPRGAEPHDSHESGEPA